MRKAGVLAAQLPDESRTMVALDPDSAVTHEAMMLRFIEHDLRVANWQRGGDKNKKRPEMLPMPSEILAEIEAGGRDDARVNNARARHVARAKAKKAQAGSQSSISATK